MMRPGIAGIELSRPAASGYGGGQFARLEKLRAELSLPFSRASPLPYRRCARGPGCAILADEFS